MSDTPVEEDFKMVGAFMSKDDEAHLIEFVKTLKPGDRMNRRTASHILSLTAQAGESGSVHELITPELVGGAVGRLVSNYTQDDKWLARFLLGLVK